MYQVLINLGASEHNVNSYFNFLRSSRKNGKISIKVEQKLINELESLITKFGAYLFNETLIKVLQVLSNEKKAEACSGIIIKNNRYLIVSLRNNKELKKQNQQTVFDAPKEPKEPKKQDFNKVKNDFLDYLNTI